MSLIQFRGHPILPPVIKEQKPKHSTDEQSREENTLLSLPPSEALKYILCGLPNFSLNNERNESSLEQNGSNEAKKGLSVKFETSIASESSAPLTRDKKKGSRIDAFKNSLSANSISEPSNVLNNKFNNKIIKEGEHVFSFNGKEISEATKSASNSFKHCYPGKDQLYKQKEEILESPSQKENSESSRTENVRYPCSNLSHKNLSAVTSHQKLKVLKSSGTNSSAYLQDYLQLLTSRSHFINVGKVKKGCDSVADPSLERRGSAPSLAVKKGSAATRHRNTSGSSDKSNLRSLGSTYLDSYLGNLTDHSWIIYPTGETVSDPSLKSPNIEKNAQTTSHLSPGSKKGDQMRRRLHFINPEKFFNVSNKKETSENPSQLSNVIKSNSSVDNDHDLGLTDTSGIVMSPDISASSLDTDKFDSSHALSTSLQETPVLEECYLNKEDSENVTNVSQDQGMSWNNERSSEASMSVQKKNGVSILGTPSSNVQPSFDRTVINKDSTCSEEESKSKNTNKLDPQVHSNIEELEYPEQEEVLNNSEESSVTSTDDAEDQVSMIVCGIQNASGTVSSNECPKHLYDKSDPSKVGEGVSSVKTHKKKSIESFSLQNSESSEIFNDFSGTDNSISKLINMLRAKHEEEMQELRSRHKQEMNNFIYQLLQLSTTQRLALADSSSLNDVFSNLSGSVSQASRSSEVITSTNSEPHKDSLTSPFNHTSLMPSFFLHEDNQDSDSEKRTDISKISQIFSLLRVSSHNAKKSSGELVTFNQNVLHKNLEDATGPDTEMRCAISKKNGENKTDPRKQITFTQKQIEVGLDLVPTRESDGDVLSLAAINSKQSESIAKLQAVLKGRRIRNLMKTSEVQRLLATLKEVAKLAHQFHHDILMDNIRKGDIDFHKALFNQEKQTRERFINIMVEMTPADQIRMVHKDRTAEQQREHQRFSDRPKCSSTVSKSFLSHETGDHLVLASKNLSSAAKSDVGAQKGEMKQVPKKSFSELPRPCKANQSPESRFLKYPSVTPRARQSLLSAPKPSATRGIPRRVLKKIEPNPQPHISHRRQNAPICKTDPNCLGLVGAKALKGERSCVTIRGDVLSARKPWR